MDSKKYALVGALLLTLLAGCAQANQQPVVQPTTDTSITATATPTVSVSATPTVAPSASPTVSATPVAAGTVLTPAQVTALPKDTKAYQLPDGSRVAVVRDQPLPEPVKLPPLPQLSRHSPLLKHCPSRTA